MLYGYQLTEEFPTSAVTHQLSVSATNGDAAALGTRKGPQLVTVTGAHSPQFGRITRSRGRVISAASAAAYSMVKSASAHVYSQTATAGSAEAAGSSQRLLRATTPANLSVGSASAINLLSAIPYHAVQAASHSLRSASLFKLVAPAGYNVASPEAVSIGRGLSSALTGAASTESFGLVRTTGAVRGIASAQGTGILRLVGRHLGTASAQARAILTLRGKVIKAASAESFGLVRRPGKLFGISSAEALGSPLGARIYNRSYGIAAAEVAAVARAMSSHFHAVLAPGPALARGSGKLFHTASAESPALRRGNAKLVAAAEANTAATLRSTNIPRSIATASVVAMLSGTRRILAARLAANTQSSSLLTLLIRGKILSASDANTAHLSTHPIKILPAIISLAQGQAIAVVRQMAVIRSIASGNAAAVFRSIGLTRAIISRQSAALFAPAVRPKAFSVASPEFPRLLSSRVKVLIAANADTAFVQYSRGRQAFATQSNTALLSRLTAKLLRISSPQSVVIGKGVTRSFRTSLAQAFGIATPHGRILSASQGQSGTTTPWYHLFVAPWAQQQTTLLPPAGGLAEPPYFAPIDPGDQTTFAFDWSARAAPNDPITSATVASVPPGLTFHGPVFVNGLLVEVTAVPFTPLQLPTTYSLRCTATFASGLRSSFSIPVRIQTL